MVDCIFEILNNGRIICKTHNQTLCYLFGNGKIICQVGEDERINEMGWIKYLKWINAVDLHSSDVGAIE